MKKTILTERFQELAGITNPFHEVIELPRISKNSDGLSIDRFDGDEGGPSSAIIAMEVADRVYDINKMIKFIDSENLSDNDLGGDIAKPVLISIATQLEELYQKLNT